MPGARGAIRLFQIAGITVFLHWSWFLVAAYEIEYRGRFSSVVWSIIEYVVLFAIVTAHEFGHALACRRTGGRAEQIVLWPLGGVAYVSPPPRPGATLWSIAAGPLVNAALIPILFAALLISTSMASGSDLATFVRDLNLMNLGLFVFNILPIYPLDGGKMLHALLWYVVGRAQSLMVAVMVGFAGVAGLGLLALFGKSVWLGVLAVFAGMQCMNGYRRAQILKRLADAPRHEHAACPSCNAMPPQVPIWTCSSCRSPFDTFRWNAACPKCNTPFLLTTCPDCGTPSVYTDWISNTSTLTAADTP